MSNNTNVNSYTPAVTQSSNSSATQPPSDGVGYRLLGLVSDLQQQNSKIVETLSKSQDEYSEMLDNINDKLESIVNSSTFTGLNTAVGVLGSVAAGAGMGALGLTFLAGEGSAIATAAGVVSGAATVTKSACQIPLADETSNLTKQDAGLKTMQTNYTSNNNLVKEEVEETGDVNQSFSDEMSKTMQASKHQLAVYK